MNWASLWLDIGGGLLIAGAISAWMPQEFWAHLFLSGSPNGARLIGPVLGPLIAVVTFVCSVGNVPLAAVLWTGGASFGGVIAFLFGDLIVLPILDIYRRYYGLKAAAVLGLVFYAAMVGAAYAVELGFGVLHLIPAHRAAGVATMEVRWDYTTWLNLAGLVTSAVLLWRFLATGGPKMLAMMSAGDPHTAALHGQGHGD
jgi:uncharacterized membrane protein YraQ (UPF0718 family)